MRTQSSQEQFPYCFYKKPQEKGGERSQMKERSGGEENGERGEEIAGERTRERRGEGRRGEQRGEVESSDFSQEASIFEDFTYEFS